MITVTVRRREGSYISLTSEGHAGYADSGEDILCAAVSVLVTNTVNSIEILAGDEVGDEEMEDGYLSCSFPSGLSEGGNLLMEAMLLGLRQIAETTDAESGEPYVRVIILED